jgi:hypothetical protein
MAKVKQTRTWRLDVDTASALAAATTAVVGAGFGVTERSDRRDTAKQGSQLRTRVLGGWFIDPSHLPKLLTVDVRAEGGGAAVSATLEDAFGPGYVDRKLAARYERGFEETLRRLAGALGEPLR